MSQDKKSRQDCLTGHPSAYTLPLSGLETCMLRWVSDQMQSFFSCWATFRVQVSSLDHTPFFGLVKISYPILNCPG